MVNSEKDFCFCTLALGQKYRNLVKQLATDLEIYSPQTYLVVATDAPQDFRGISNIIPYKHSRQGVLYCYDDKRFAIQKALTKFRVAIFVDADTRILSKVPEDILWPPGITCAGFVKILDHPPNQEREGRKEAIKDLSKKLNISLEGTSWVNENLFIIARDEGREIEFIRLWGKIGRYFEIKGVDTKDGNPIGLAAAKVGWKIMSDRWDELDKIRSHTYAHWDFDPHKVQTVWEKLENKLKLAEWKRQYRLLKAQLISLQDINFYYR
jgi:nuclear transport factor 2 (NTF2) superfamily protein